MSDPQVRTTAKVDAVLVGTGIMSATLGALLRRLEPDWSITVVERLDAAAAESSDPWNNAGTGHAGLCELFYTPQQPDGSIDVTKAVRVNEQFQITRQFWAYAAENGMLSDVRGFLNPVPHVSFGQGAERVDYLRRRRQALAGNPLFARTEWIEDPDEFARRLPYMAAKRDFSEPVALNWAADGTDVDFGALSRQLIGYGVRNGTTVLFGHEVRNLSRQRDGSWTLTILNRRTGENRRLNAKFVFVGAGGHALPLLQKSGIKEAKGFGGFPIGGKFLRACNPAITAAHRAKVYGLPAPGAPAMTAAHLDARIVNGKPWLLFGPFAGWSPKFLKHGHISDLPRSVTPGNLATMIGAGVSQVKLVNYLIGQLRLLAAHPGRRAAGIRAQRSGFRLAADDGRSAGAGDPASLAQRWSARIRHHGARRRRRQHRRPARCIAGGLDRSIGDARRAAALLSRPVSDVAAYAQGHGAVVGGHLVR